MTNTNTNQPDHALRITSDIGGDLKFYLVCNLPKGSPCHLSTEGEDLEECNRAAWANEDLLYGTWEKDQQIDIPVECGPWQQYDEFDDEGFRIKFKG